MQQTKPLIGLEETVTLTGKDQSTASCLAKIDTGARTSSIAVELAAQLGFGDIYNICLQAMSDLSLEAERYDDLKIMVAKRLPQLQKQCSDIVDVQVIKAANGVTIRPFVAVQFTLAGETVSTAVSIANRSHMTYPMLVGRVDLNKFLIDPSRSNQ